jgi:hypothetical protein
VAPTSNIHIDDLQQTLAEDLNIKDPKAISVEPENQDDNRITKRITYKYYITQNEKNKLVGSDSYTYEFTVNSDGYISRTDYNALLDAIAGKYKYVTDLLMPGFKGIAANFKAESAAYGLKQHLKDLNINTTNLINAVIDYASKDGM